MLHTASFSGGKDSLAMILLIQEKGLPLDLIVYADVGWDFQETHNTVNEVRERINVPIEVIDLRERFRYYFYDHRVTKGKNIGKRVGFPTRMMRWCTRDKGRALDRFFKEKADGGTLVNYIGIAADEAHRAEGSEIHAKKYIERRFPLIDEKMTEEMCLKYCYEKGFNFSGYYEKFNRSGCFCCPLQPLSALRQLYKHYPDLWEKLEDMQNYSNIPFRPKTRVHDLTVRFQEEGVQQIH